MFKNKKKGFTLIELLVVIAIIGILSSVVLASLNSARKKSRDARRVADIKQIQLALELYFDSVSPNAYPTTLGALVTGGHIASEPTDPITQDSYSYAYSGSTYYHLGANLEETNHAALNSDKDCDSSATSCPAGVIYTSGGFNGIDAATCGATAGAAGTDLCYDVTP